MPNETLPARPETPLHGERLYESFLDGLRLVSRLEKGFTKTILGIDDSKLNDLQNLSLEELEEYTSNLRDVYYGGDEKPALHNAIIDNSLRKHIDEDPERYAAFQYPQFITLAKKLSRLGILTEFTRSRVVKARALRHYASQRPSPQRAAINGLRQAGRVDDIITFNHAMRDFINSGVGKLMDVDRSKTRQIMKVLLMGDKTAADEIEQGIALEVAAKRLLDRMLEPRHGKGCVACGTVQQDKEGKDIVLFPGSVEETYIDIKATPPDSVRDQLSSEELHEPGFIWEDRSKAFLWLGYGNSVGNNYGLPADFVESVGNLVVQSQPQRAIA
jgi:hypothetical protein